MRTSNKTYLSVASVAQRYEVSINTIWRWTREKTFPEPVKFGDRATRWRLSDLERWEVKA